MTATPLFLQRPDIPGYATDEHDRWKKQAVLNFPGGYIAATYGNLIQTFTMAGTDACSGTTVNVSRTGHTRTNTIGGGSINVAAKTFSYKKYPKRNSSASATGQLVHIFTDVGDYDARLGGDIQDLVGWLCGNGTAQLYGPISFTSPNGAFYGPFSPIVAN